MTADRHDAHPPTQSEFFAEKRPRNPNLLEDALAGAGEPRRVSLVRLSSEIARSLAPVGRVAVDGEVHRATLRTTRWWFTLRDRAAQIAVSIPAAKVRAYPPKDGERVRVTGRLSWQSDRGTLRFDGEALEPVGEGAVAALIAQARERLAADGLLDRPRRPLPLLPRTIGIVCGAEAAVRADIESVVAARFPGYPVTFLEVSVSGPGAVDAITGALVELDRRAEVDVIVLARGGGDATQLLPFSDEALCRAVCASTTPVVSAIGHDGDRPLCDEVADVRCGTPSIAAARIVPDRAQLRADLDRALARVLDAASRRVDVASSRLSRVDREAALVAGVGAAGRRLHAAGERLALVHPSNRVADARRRLDAGHAHMEALSPRRVLERGYAVVRRRDEGTVVRRAARQAPGDGVEVEVGEGPVGARVEHVEEADGDG
jgi:exodeoxyribonuclease VII large subunit